MPFLVPVLVAASSGLAFYFSIGLSGSLGVSPGVLWALALLAPIPVLWSAFHRRSNGWVTAGTGFAAMGIGMLNFVPAYAGVMPAPALVLAAVLPALAFSLSVVAGRFVALRLAPISGVIVFAAMWTGFDYLLSLGSNGTALSPAYSQVAMPLMIQSASVFGIWGITAVMGLFAAAAGMFFATRQKAFVVVALGILVLNLGYGAWRIAEAPKSEVVRVGLAGSDALVGIGLKDNEASTLNVANAYREAGRKFAGQKLDLIVFPEKIAVLEPKWRDAVNSQLQTLARDSNALVVAGFDDRANGRQNNALIYAPSGAAPTVYTKRHLVPGLEAKFSTGAAGYMTGNLIGVAICKDMDFPETLRSDAILGPTLYAVPAWDFDKDAVWHARLAIMRGVENGFAVARAANDGLLTLSDGYGRVKALKQTNESGMVILSGEISRGPGTTLYGRVGDTLAYLALALSGLLLAVAFFAKRGAEKY